MNKESTWKECIETNSSRSVSSDKGKIKSLINTAKGRNKFLNENETKRSNANYIFEGYYTSVLEILHALVLKEGYKVTNHICLGYYLRDVLEKEDLFRTFDDCRFKRNSLIYYGRKMDFEVAKNSIEKCKKLIHKILELTHNV